MNWKTCIVIAVICLVAIFAGYLNAQVTPLEKAKAQVALEEAKERRVILRVVEEEVRLKVSIIENQVKLARLQVALTPADPNVPVDPNNTEN